MTRVLELFTPDAGELASLVDVLSPEERRRAAAFRRVEDRDRYVIAHVWLRRVLGEALGVAAPDVPIEAGDCVSCGLPHGKPRLPAHTELHFSLSHAGDVVLCALASTPVGVDVEAVPDDARHLELLSVLHPSERDAGTAAAVMRCWVRKEAYLKGTGEGLSREPHTVRVGAGPTPEHPDGWRLSDVDVRPGYVAAVAVRREWSDERRGAVARPRMRRVRG
ncbi:4'-phosphopantetheinyl transferase family protein [Solirubrobacter soli]|uniref:4'-phosphopantetheinyl transferase family protein n=1 Tax=Solirubrobacter soli TaxID=363832 RepID=UPI0004223716|nr:4'-phosphopantetheinyl transferase superfamily protein [Solirubrobacter soli]